MKTKIALVLMVLLTAFAKNPFRRVTGTITDSARQPVIGVTVHAGKSHTTTTSDSQGKYVISVNDASKFLTFSHPAYQTQKIMLVPGQTTVNVTLQTGIAFDERQSPAPAKTLKMNFAADGIAGAFQSEGMPMSVPASSERYQAIEENSFRKTSSEPLTTFSIDVDRASYSNVRRFLNMGQMPPADAVRIEEMMNYFDYNYPEPDGRHPIAMQTTLTESPWNKGLQLLHVGLRTKSIPVEKLPSSNLVFLIDVSGSMGEANKLPLLKQSFNLLVSQLRPEDRVSIVVYAGAAGVVLAPTSGREKDKIRDALNSLDAGGSTAGGEGIELAYKLAKEHFIPKGNNRVLLATDGDFNVGPHSESELQRLIECKRSEGIFLSVLGFGMGNYKDGMMETLADKGNGNYAYIDNIQEARKQFVTEFGGTMFTVAKDVKIQIEFNPQHVQAYRLIGYENRALQHEDFHDDKKDAGEMGAGHMVTAIYELVPNGIESNYLRKTDALKYQQRSQTSNNANEMLTLKIRYKQPASEQSELFETPVMPELLPFSSCPADVRFAAAVAGFGLLLRDSPFKGSATYADIATHAQAAIGDDREGYRSEMVRLVKTAALLHVRSETARKD